jgi:hypothetical protein
MSSGNHALDKGRDGSAWMVETASNNAKDKGIRDEKSLQQDCGMLLLRKRK